MTASTEWFQIVSVREPNKKVFSTCARAYAKKVTQCFCGSAVASNSHEKFHLAHSEAMASVAVTSALWNTTAYSESTLRRNQELAAGALLLFPEL